MEISLAFISTGYEISLVMVFYKKNNKNKNISEINT